MQNNACLERSKRKKFLNPARTLLVEFLEKKLPYGTEMSFSQSRTEVLMP
jgi:hypothetical protein